MRSTAGENGILVKAYAGVTGVMLAMTVTDLSKLNGLLGFAIYRKDHTLQRNGWLMGGLNFPGIPHKPGAQISTHRAPIQRFRWSDYRVYPGAEYTYTVHPVYWKRANLAPEERTAKNLDMQPGPSITVRTGPISTAGDPGAQHCVVFNRAVAASQSFASRFAEFEKQIQEARRARQPLPPMPAEAKSWLARDLLKQILWFIDRAAGPGWALDIAIYEYELPEIIQAIEAAHARGAHVRVVYHARPGDEQTSINQENLRGLPESALRARLTTSICHHKFIVLSRYEEGPGMAQARIPVAVLCGSTNFTENGVYRQANFVHTVEREDTACQYAMLFEQLFSGTNRTDTRKYINLNNPFPEQQDFFAGFSPRSGRTDLTGFVRCVQSAQRDVLFSTTFNLYDPLEDGLLGQPHDPLLRYGLQNSRSRITGIHADRTADFVVAGLYSSGVEGWLKESTYGQRGNILIHTKLIIVDFTSDSPLLIAGSHNFSAGASEDNDENYLVVRGDVDVTDAYGCEFMRLYDHYRFRWHQKEQRVEGAAEKPLTLAVDDSWTIPYFAGDSIKCTDRLAFTGLPL